ASLTKPVFYQDNRHTLFVEPSVTETTIEEWQGWVTPAPRPDPAMQEPGWWNEGFVIAEIPGTRPDPDSTASKLGLEIDQGSFIKPSQDKDWLLNPQTALQFDGVLLGPTGQPGLQIRVDKVGETVAAGEALLKVNSGSGLGSGREVIVADTTTFEQSGLIQGAGGLNVVGNGGFNSVLKKNFNGDAIPKEFDATSGASRN
ncbi:MAG: hypothetical protein GY826_21575, partial [Fuerstiella sp.]|nr:hypothetical protein [Fuerstiella sp.]